MVLEKTVKSKQLVKSWKKSFETQKDIVANVFEMEKTELSSSSTATKHNNEILQKSKDLDKLLYLMKEKLQNKTLSIRQKIQILTIAPVSWSRAESESFSTCRSTWFEKHGSLPVTRVFWKFQIPKEVRLYHLK